MNNASLETSREVPKEKAKTRGVNYSVNKSESIIAYLDNM